MSTNRFIFSKSQPQKNYSQKRAAGNFRRSMASSIDSLILLVIRGMLLQLYGELYFVNALVKFGQDFQQEFGTEIPKMVASHTKYIMNHSISLAVFFAVLALILVGAVYHGYFNSSAWKATIGKRIFEIKATTKDGKKISFLRGATHYLLSILPLTYIIYIAVQAASKSTSIYETITGSTLNLVMGIAFAIWVQFSFLTKSKSTISDIICKIIVIEGKTNSKFPWKSKEKSSTEK